MRVLENIKKPLKKQWKTRKHNSGRQFRSIWFKIEHLFDLLLFYPLLVMEFNVHPGGTWSFGVRYRYLFDLWYTVGVFTFFPFGFCPINEYIAMTMIHMNELLTDFRLHAVGEF